MRRHGVRPDPRAHWILLVLGMWLLVGLLTLHGYPKKTAPPQQLEWNQAAGAHITDGGAVLREAGGAGYLSVLSNVEGIITVHDGDSLGAAVSLPRQYATVTGAIGAPSALSPAP